MGKEEKYQKYQIPPMGYLRRNRKPIVFCFFLFFCEWLKKWPIGHYKPEITRWGKKKSYGAPHIFGPGEEEKVEKVDKGGVYEVFM